MTLPKPGGFPAISRWSSEARAIPPDSLLAKKRDLKQAAMQQLLTG